jgi:hypothetical protein
MAAANYNSTRIEVVEDRVAEALGRKSPEQRLAMVFDANRTARLLLEGAILTSHPEWTRPQVKREIARRMLGTD